MHRQRVMVAAATVFTFGVAFAAQPTARADRNSGATQLASPWVPGANMLMSAHEPRLAAPMPPPVI